jgi:hypothetical protein
MQMRDAIYETMLRAIVGENDSSLRYAGEGLEPVWVWGRAAPLIVKSFRVNSLMLKSACKWGVL